MRAAHSKSVASGNRLEEGDFLARKIPFIAPKWSNERLPKNDLDVYITVEFYTDAERQARGRLERLTLCGDRPPASRPEAEKWSTLNAYFKPRISTVYRLAYGLAQDGKHLTQRTQKLVEENYPRGSYQYRQVKQHAQGTGFRSSMRLKIVHEGSCVGYAAWTPI
jgi:hypothetical protein